MSQKSIVAAVTFADETKADAFLKGVKRLETDQQVTLHDAVIVTKDSSGKAKVHETKDLTVGKGAAKGGVLGFVVGFFFGGPLGGAVLGAAAGALLGKKLDLGISREKIEAVEAAMQPGSTAVFVQLQAERLDVLAALVRELDGTVLDLGISEDMQMQVAALAAASRTSTGGMDHLA